MSAKPRRGPRVRPNSTSVSTTAEAAGALAGVERKLILGLEISAVSMDLMVKLVAEAVASRRKMRVAFCTVHTIVESQDNPDLRAAINGCQVASPDGMPLVWLSRARGAKGVERVYGPDTVLACCADGLVRGYRHFFYGSTRETLAALERRLCARFSGLAIAGSYAPPFRDLSVAEDEEIVKLINAARPDIVWIGLGMPRQDLWAASHQARIDAPVLMAVGAAFDFHAGTVRQAPRWMQRSGLEWLYRLVQEPRRLWRRYLIGNSRFVWLVLSHELLHRGA